nr:hypothetical protein [Tanacetum cinerariifolium]
LDEQWFNLHKDILKDALDITPTNDNDPFVAPPSSDTVIEYVNTLGYLSTLKNMSTMLVNALYQPWSAILSMINMCFIEFVHSIQTFLTDRKNLATASHGKKKTTHLLIPSIRYVGKDGREIFGMPIPDALLTYEIKGAPYYGEYQEHVAKYQQHLDAEHGKATEGGETKSFKATKVTKPKAAKATKQASDPKPKPAPTQPPKAAPEMKQKLVQETSDEPSPAKRSKGGLVRKIRKPMSLLKLVDEPSVEDVPVEEPAYNAEEANLQQALEPSLEEQVERTQGPARPVVIREPDSRRIQPLPEVQGKGKKKVVEEQAAHDLLTLQTLKNKSLMDHKTESNDEVPKINTEDQDEGQARPNPDLEEARQKKRKRRDVPRTPSGSPSPKPLPPPPVAGAFGAPASAPQSTTWTTSDTRYELAGLYGTQELSPMDSLIPDDSIPDEQAHLSDDEDSGNDHLPTADSRNGCGNHYLQKKDHRLLNLLGPFILPKYQMLRTTRLLRWLQLM